MTHKYLVLATNVQDFRKWCLSKNLQPNIEAIQVTSSYHLRGYSPKDITIIKLGEWTSNLTNVGLQEIFEQLDMYEAMGTTIAEDEC